MFMARTNAADPNNVYHSGPSVFLSPSVSSVVSVTTPNFLVRFERFNVLPLECQYHLAKVLYLWLDLTFRKARGRQ
jgi:hypothetical protein